MPGIGRLRNIRKLGHENRAPVSRPYIHKRVSGDLRLEIMNKIRKKKKGGGEHILVKILNYFC